MLIGRMLAVAGAAVITVAACTGPAEPGEVLDRTVERVLTLHVEGAHALSFDDRVKLHVVTRQGEREQADFNVAAVELLEPIELGPELSAIFEVALVGALYDGDGDYQLPAGLGIVRPAPGGATTSTAGGTGSFSHVSVIFYGLGPDGVPVSETRFGFLAEPCDVRVDDGATVGEVSCPALLSAGAERVSLTASWRP